MPAIYIKNMVCPRCIKVVREELTKAGFQVLSVELGKAEIDRMPDDNEYELLRKILNREGFELLEDPAEKLVEEIKIEIISIVRKYKDFNSDKFVLSKYLAEKTGRDYHKLSAVFSQIEGVTIEQFLILQKIEKVKELLEYRNMNISEISYELGYSSVQHLSRQFKKVTGLTASEFKKSFKKKRKTIDNLK